MKPLYLKVVLFDPVTDETFDVFDGVQVGVVRILAWNPTVGFDELPMIPDAATKTFVVNEPDYKAGRHHYLRVGLLKPNFSKRTGTLLAYNEVNTNTLPTYVLARFPYWDTGWDDDYETNEYFTEDDCDIESSAQKPFLLRVPIRDFYIASHHGARTFYPENTIASFRKALDLGANGIEIDICATKDFDIVLYHDASLLAMETLARPLIEEIPHRLLYPKFLPDPSEAKQVVFALLAGNQFRESPPQPLFSRQQYDTANLTLAEVRQYYHYPILEGLEYQVPTLDEFLQFASAERRRLRFVFIDTKNPDWDIDEAKRSYVQYALTLAKAIKRYANLPDKILVCNPNETALGYIKQAFKDAGETRCKFAYDAQGGIGPAVGVKKNALQVARRMHNEGISVGATGRQGDFDEIKQAIRDRDYNPGSPVETVIHWTMNDTAQMYDSFAAGVNGILTDKPDELARLLARLKMKIS